MSTYDDEGGATRANDYWATREGPDIVSSMHEQVKKYCSHIDESGRRSLWHRSHCAYYGLDSKGNWQNAAAVSFGGEQGENVLMRVNHYRSLHDHILVLTTGSRPSFTARSANGDYKSQAQTQLAEGILDYYLTTKLENQAKQCAAYAVRYSEGWLFVGWDANDGDPVNTSEVPATEDGEPVVDEQGQPVMEQKVEYSGDVLTRVYKPEDIARDVTGSDQDECQWVIAHRRVSRWDLASKYPEHESAILSAPEWASPYDRYEGGVARKMGGELVSVFELWHDITDAMPDGRMVLTCGEAVLMDVPLPFEELPFIPMCPAYEDGTPFGYSGHFDLLALQEAYDAAYSTILTNHDAFARQTIWAAKGSGFSARDLDGMTLVESDEPPQVLNLLQAQAESYKLLETIKNDMEQLSGINSVARGEPQASLKSGSALALVHSMAVQYNAGIQHGYAKLFEKMGTMLISRLKTFAQSKRMAEITGKRGRALLVEFKGDDISDIQRVVVELGSAILRTSAGRKELADKFFEFGQGAMTFDQYLEVMSTGRLDPVLERPQAARMNVIRENESLMEGQPAIAMVTDNHQEHISEHLSLLDDPSVRSDGLLSAMVLEHVQHHANLWVQADPVLLAATGQQPAPAPMTQPMPPPMVGGGGPVPGGAPPSIPDANMGVDMSGQPGAVQAPGMPNMPDLPPGTDPSLIEAQTMNGVPQ